jgi:hypothetical protein
MSFNDWTWLGSVLLWGFFGFGAGYAYRNHDMVGFGLGLALWIIFPVGLAVRRLVSQARWRREWERRYGKPWTESEAAKIQERER